MENSPAVSQTIKYRLTVWSINSIPRYVSKRNGYTHPQETYMNVHGSVAHNDLRVEIREITQIYISWWMDKQNVVYPFNRMLLISRKKNKVLITLQMNQPWKPYAKWKKPTV